MKNEEDDKGNEDELKLNIVFDENKLSKNK